MLTASNHSIRCPHCGKVAATVVVADNADMECALSASVTLSSPIDAYPWPRRIRTAFHDYQALVEIDGHWKYIDAPIKTFGDLCSLTRFDLRRMPNVGGMSVNQVEQILASSGLRLASS